MPSAIEACAGGMPFSLSRIGVHTTVSASTAKAGRTAPTAAASASAAVGEQVLDRSALDALLVGDKAGVGGQVRADPADDAGDRAPVSPPRAIRKRSDSGSQISRTTPTTSGAMPPNQKIASQPKLVRMKEFRKPPTDPPSGNADQIRLATMARRRPGANSEASARKQGVAPPRPMPAAKRTAKQAARRTTPAASPA